MKAPCPNEACSMELDYELVPGYSAHKQMAGKFCPACHHPLDPETAKRETLDYGPSSKEIQEVRMKKAEAFVAACKYGKTAVPEAASPAV